MGALLPDRRECQPLDPPACGALFDMGQYLLEAAHQPLAAFEAPEGSPCADEGLDLIVSLNEPAVDLCDALFVWLVSYQPDPRSVGRADQSASGADFYSPNWLATWQIELWEAAYPIFEIVDGRSMIKLPDAASLNAINQQVYGHGLAMYHGLVDAAHDGSMWPTGTTCGSQLRLGSMTPAGPLGGCAGWKILAVGPVPTFP